MSTRRSVLAGLAIAPVCLVSISCQKSDTKVLIGATVVVAPGAQPLPDAVILISGGRVRMAGLRKDVPIPQDSERTDLTGKWIVPAAGGRLATNQPASLLVLNSNHPVDVARCMNKGEWQ